LAEKNNENENATAKITPFKCDLRVESDILKLFAFIKTNFKQLDICINNAGVLHDASVATGSFEHWREMLDINVLAVAICCQEAVNLMKEKGIEGQIINIGSLAGHKFSDYSSYHFYSATKTMLVLLTEGLRKELRSNNSRIKVAVINSGLVRTDILAKGIGETASEAIFKSTPCFETEDIAQLVVTILDLPMHVDVNDILARPINVPSDFDKNKF
jgi:dehydrogenase/reductase SDR family member 11